MTTPRKPRSPWKRAGDFFLVVVVLAMTAGMAFIGFGRPPSITGRVVGERHVTGVVTRAPADETALDRRAEVRLGDHQVRASAASFGHVERGDRVVVVDQTHEGGRHTYRLVGRVGH